MNHPQFRRIAQNSWNWIHPTPTPNFLKAAKQFEWFHDGIPCQVSPSRGQCKGIGSCCADSSSPQISAILVGHFIRGKWRSPQIFAILRKTSTKIAQKNVKILAREIPNKGILVWWGTTRGTPTPHFEHFLEFAIVEPLMFYRVVLSDNLDSTNAWNYKQCVDCNARNWGRDNLKRLEVWLSVDLIDPKANKRKETKHKKNESDKNKQH